MSNILSMVASYIDSAMHFEKFKRRDAERRNEQLQKTFVTMDEKLKYYA